MIYFHRREPLDRVLILVLVVLSIAGLMWDHQKFFLAWGVSSFMRTAFWVLFAEGEGKRA